MAQAPVFLGRMSKSAAGQEQQAGLKAVQMNLWWTGYQWREQLATRNKSNRIQRMGFLRILFACAWHKQPRAVGNGL